MYGQGHLTPTDLLVDTTPGTPDTVGATRDDTPAVRDCIEDAVEYYHENLPDELRNHITEKWGITDEMIDARKIGFEGSGNGVIDHLRTAGYDVVTITRAGIGTSPVLKHTVECGGITKENTHLLQQSETTDNTPQYVAECHHSNIPEAIDRLALARITDQIDPEEIDLDAVVEYCRDETARNVSVWSWWNNRIIFPYRDTNGDICYLIGRATEETDDKVYSNGVVDRSDEYVTTIAETVLADVVARERDDIPSEILDEFIVLPHATTRFDSPYKTEYADFIDTVLDLLHRHATRGDVTNDEFRRVGLMHAPGTASELRDTDTTQLHVLPRNVLDCDEQTADDRDRDCDYILSPPAIGVSPGAGVAVNVVNHTDVDVTVNSALPGGESVVSLRELTGDPSAYDDVTVTVRGVVTDVFVLTDAQAEWIAQRGVISDGTGTALFTIPSAAADSGGVETVSVGEAYEFTDVTGSVYDGDVSVEVTRSATVTRVDAHVASQESYSISCRDRGLHRFTIDVGGERHRGLVTVFDSVHTDRRNETVEEWVDGEPAFEVDVPKYLKQTIDRAWINRDAVQEPIFGVETVHEGKPLIVTEGVTDAIAAHQHGFPCVAPATTNFKKHHYEEICQHADRASGVFIVNDTEINDAGINGALRTAKVIENDGHTVRVGELPLPDGDRKIDVAEFLKTYGRDAFLDVLSDAVVPDEHPVYDAARHDPQHGPQAPAETRSGDGTSSDGSPSSREINVDSENVSALYSLELRDVIDFDALDTSGVSGSTIYRGPHPVQHHGNSTGYFVIRDHGDDGVSAKDYKIESTGDGYYYNALTWLATAAECDCGAGTGCDCTRSVTRPMGSLSNSEVWWAWRDAKTADHIPFPDGDPVPVKAIWFLAAHHDLVPKKFVPETWDDGKQLPATKYNAVLDIIRDEYGLDPGREKR